MEAIFHESHPESVHLTIGGKPHLTAEPHHSRPSRFTQTRLDIQRFPHVRQQNADSKSIGLAYPKMVMPLSRSSPLELDSIGSDEG
jgi:hypothetical protein